MHACIGACVHAGEFGNPSSKHPLGCTAAAAVARAREAVAAALGAPSECITFTSGATGMHIPAAACAAAAACSAAAICDMRFLLFCFGGICI